MPTRSSPSRSVDPTDSPIAWFAVLERARITGNHELAAKAEAELRRLGVSVKFTHREGVGHDH